LTKPNLNKDLDWFFNDSPSVSSNYQIVINAAFGRLPADPEEKLISTILSGTPKRNRAIYQSLNLLTKEQQRQLDATYRHEYQNQYPPELKLFFRHLTGIVLTILPEHQFATLLLITNKKIQNRQTSDDSIYLHYLYSRAEHQLDKLHQSFQDAFKHVQRNQHAD